MRELQKISCHSNLNSENCKVCWSFHFLHRSIGSFNDLAKAWLLKRLAAISCPLRLSATAALLFPGYANADDVVRASVVEFSVDVEATSSMKVCWRIGEPNQQQKAIVYELKNFSFEWVIPPKEATGMIAVPIDFDLQKATEIHWIAFSPRESAGNSFSGNSYYVPFLLDAKQKPPVIDSSYLEITAKDSNMPDPRVQPSRPSANDGWCFLGIWRSETSAWSSLEWNYRKGAESLANRIKPYSLLPSALAGLELVSDFNWKMRKGPSIEYEEMEPGRLVRAGTIVKISEVAVDSKSPDYRVWGKIQLINDKLIDIP